MGVVCYFLLKTSEITDLGGIFFLLKHGKLISVVGFVLLITWKINVHEGVFFLLKMRNQ